jgi:catechol 2,3-dioxygenase-like lactoylglutathione lyase family enzyme
MDMIGWLFHVAIKTNDPARTLAFYKDILGLLEAPRPCPGAWLAVPMPRGQGIFHI